MQTPSEKSPIIRVMFGGDVMLGRNVKEYILRFGPEYPLGPIAPLMRSANLTIINLECAITSSLDQWPGERKAFYFGASPQAITSLTAAGVDMVSLANNHALDFGVEGLLDTFATLRSQGIRYAGAGIDRSDAFAPAIVECNGMRFGMAAFCDHQADFAAGEKVPGIAWLDFDDEPAVEAVWRNALERLKAATVDWSILSLHWGPNMVFRPSKKFRRLAHAAIDMGWKILFGHSAHVFHGIEIYRGCPIIYAAGDLVDDYRVDAEFRNDHQLLFEVALSRDVLHQISLHPVFIDDCRTQHASAAQAEYILRQMSALCEEMGTVVQRDAGCAWIDGLLI
ncbi:MAG TPA: CapA family protein [Noviherbaspirillum sp.]|nr:CapA family protein [Noviherbaspirillum sp.]